MFDITETTAKSIITGFQIPAKPQALADLQLEQAQPSPSPNAFAEVISKDVALSANVLKTVNSPVFGLNRTITDIKQAAMLLGCDNISNLVSFFQLQTAFKGKNSAISHEKYWDTAMETANMMSILLTQMNLQSECPIEDAYAFGLFRDCGIPLMAMKYADYKDTLIKANNQPDTIFTDIEEEHYQTNHAIVGFFVANSWNLPKSLCELILRHHEPDFLDASDTSDLQKKLYALVKIASNALNQYKFMTDDSEWLLAKEPVLDFLGLTEFDHHDIEEDIKESFRTQFG
ncbi:MAG: HDOD domain-containing protein [Proteobacteria bacterium]|nr:HDOD domain-containing protein [Pseudomonadota bacterium]